MAMRFAVTLVLLAQLLAAGRLAYGEEPFPWPEKTWETAKPGDVGLDERQLIKAREYALTGDGSGYITRGGKLVMSWGDARTRYDLKSTPKSFGATALGLAILDGNISLSETGWLDKITILRLATPTLRWNDFPEDSRS